jgi:serine/threonine protein kinase
MSPEQVLGRDVTEASDLFSFGVVLYEMLTGESAFSTRTVTATLHHLVNWEPVPIQQARPETPRELVEICQKLLAKNSRDRYPNAETVFDFLTWLERGYGLITTSAHLAEFLESPETYRKVSLQAADLSSLDKAPPLRAPRHVSWGMTAVVNATMFLAGVLFIKGVKTYFELNKASTPPVVQIQRQLNPEPAGILERQVVPASVSTYTPVESDSTATTPSASQLQPGWHDISPSYPHSGMKKENLKAVAGDTVRQRVDLSKP